MITGVVLAGGRSVRFGKNKALEPFGQTRLVERAVQSMRPFCSHMMIVANELAPFLDMEVILVRDIIPHQGPLGGLYTALLFSTSEWIFVKATDMPFLVPRLATLMIGAKEGFDAVVPRVNEHYEPLLSLYHRRCFPHIARQIESTGERKIAGFYRKINLRSIREEEWRAVDPGGISFKNVNTPQDLAELQWI